MEYKILIIIIAVAVVAFICGFLVGKAWDK